MREYEPDDIIALVRMHKKYGMSVRDLESITKIPKSVIGRWTKNPDEWLQHYEKRDTLGNILDKEQRNKARNRLEKFIDMKKSEKQKKLRIRYDEVDDYVKVDSP